MKRTVGQRCTICNHPARPQIDLAIATGLSKRAVAQRFGVSPDAVWRHAQAEVAAVFRQAGLRAATEMGASPEKMIAALPVEAGHAA